MTLKLLNKTELQFINKNSLKYDLATAEKDYRNNCRVYRRFIGGLSEIEIDCFFGNW